MSLSFSAYKRLNLEAYKEALGSNSPCLALPQGHSPRSASIWIYAALFLIKLKRFNRRLTWLIEISGNPTGLEAIDGIDGKIER